MSLDIAHLQQWIGKTETRSDQVTPVPVAALSATLDRDDPPPRPVRPCPPCGTGCTSCPSTGNRKSAPTATRPAAGSCRRYPCRAACGPAATCASIARCGWAIRSRALRALSRSRTRKAARGRWCSSWCVTRSALRKGLPWPRNTTSSIATFRGPANRRRSRGPRRASRRGRGKSGPTTCCCSAIRRSPSTATASTTTAAMSQRWKATPAWWCTVP